MKIRLNAQYKSVPTGFKAAQNFKLFSPNYGKHFALLIYGIGQFICENAPSIDCTSVRSRIDLVSPKVEKKWHLGKAGRLKGIKVYLMTN